jgi:putative ABC transport system substrate-binding protein
VGSAWAALAAVLLFSALPVAAQPAGRTPRIGLMSVGTDPERPAPQWAAFLEALGALGYVEGRNLVVERRFAAGRFERMRQFAAELVQRNVDVIVVTGTREVQAAIEATKTIPIVTVVAPDPVAAGLAASLARPGGNVTGLTFSADGVGGKSVELLREAVPGAARMAVLASRPQSSTVRRELEEAARSLGVTFVPVELVKTPDDFDAFFTRARREGVGAVVVTSDGVTNVHRQRVVDAAARARIPVIYPVREFVELGGLMAYGPTFSDLFRRAATFVDRILKGARPADLPIEQPAKFELVVNLRTAKALGVTIPPALLARADQVLP